MILPVEKMGKICGFPRDKLVDKKEPKNYTQSIHRLSIGYPQVINKVKIAD